MNAPSALTLALALTAAASAHAQTPRAVFLLDRSGSMVLGGSPNRCEASAEACRNDVSAFFAAFPNGEVTIREFNSAFPTGSRAVPGFPEWQSVATSGSLANVVVDCHETVDSSVDCSGATPLADAICDSASALLIRGIISPSAECFFYVYSDGGENSSAGACSGGDATNATTGRCSFDTFAPGTPYETDAMGLASWQQNCCAQIEALHLSCDLVMNVYKFDAFGIVVDQGFQFLDSASRGTGGFSLSVPDGTIPVPGGFQVFPTGCSDNTGLQPLVQVFGMPELGADINIVMQSGHYRRFLLIGFDAFDQGIDLGLVGAPGCELSVNAAVTIPNGTLSLLLPAVQAFIGVNLEIQGVGLATLPGQNPVLTSNRLRLTINR
ncbi:MAG: hypothetical protein AAF196_08625 [Planctomycetota bacterium]